jgi:hypothetical protein
MNAAAILGSLEEAEFRGVDALGRLAQGDPRPAQLQALLTKARAVKGNLLARSPGILRKGGGGGKVAISLPVPGADVAKRVHETRDRIAEEQRLAGPGKRRYRAPEALRGKRIALIDGRSLDIPEHGVCELADGRHPATSAAESPVHHQLVRLGFEALPDGHRDGLAVVKSALRRPMVGDEALLSFLNRNARSDQ